MLADDKQVADILKRLRRIEGQVGGIIRMIESDRDCSDVVTQLAAVSRALDRAGFKIISCGLRECIAREGAGPDAGSAIRPGLTIEEMERLFLALA